MIGQNDRKKSGNESIPSAAYGCESSSERPKLKTKNTMSSASNNGRRRKRSDGFDEIDLNVTPGSTAGGELSILLLYRTNEGIRFLNFNQKI